MERKPHYIRWCKNDPTQGMCLQCFQRYHKSWLEHPNRGEPQAGCKENSK